MPTETSSLKIPWVVRTVSEEKLNMTTIFEEEEGNVKAVSRRYEWTEADSCPVMIVHGWQPVHSCHIEN